MKFNFAYKQSCFSLIELIVTMCISLILITIGLYNYNKTMIVSKRNDASLSLRRTLLTVNSSDSINVSSATVPNISIVSGLPLQIICPYNPPYVAGNVNALSPIVIGEYISGGPAISICYSQNALYTIEYQPDGFSGIDINGNSLQITLADTERLILKATVANNASQKNDIVNCRIIYLTNMNNIYPTECVK